MSLTVSCILRVMILALQSYCLSKHHVWIWLSFFYNRCVFFSVQCIFRPRVYSFRWESANEMRIIEMIFTRKLMLCNLCSLTVYCKKNATLSLWNSIRSNLSAMHCSIKSDLYVLLGLIPSKKEMFIGNAVFYLYFCMCFNVFFCLAKWILHSSASEDGKIKEIIPPRQILPFFRCVQYSHWGCVLVWYFCRH